ncbi:hypothetical protein [Deinococcus knuensis]|uniref:hypothetical protein n=1 Tax=Deinococcus knuensis TaxID=1837380 RepID=UPI0016684729|nr:hypothetical protein [Deinococcus knuensis]
MSHTFVWGISLFPVIRALKPPYSTINPMLFVFCSLTGRPGGMARTQTLTSPGLPLHEEGSCLCVPYPGRRHLHSKTFEGQQVT